MTLIKSISGIRGTIGGKPGENLTPLDVLRFTTAYAYFIKKQNDSSKEIVIGRDARISGEMISNIVSGVLIGCGLDVLDIGLSTTPTVEMAVKLRKSAGGIIITASHNPKEWNALKLLNNKGEFLSKENGERILEFVDNNDCCFSNIDRIGKYGFNDTYNNKHIEEVLNLPLVDVDLVRSSNFKVVVDGVNSSGGIIVPELLNRMGVDCIKLFCDPNGNFPHDPEPLPENLSVASKLVIKEGANLGIVVDPDVDRLAMICEDGSMFGEEYTLVAVSDFVLSKKPGNTVSNLSSTRALREVTESYHCNYMPSAVGEVNVVNKMKEINAVIGGEGNGGVIYPELHYGRDALVGIALFLTHLASCKLSMTELKSTYPKYFISKNKIKLDDSIDLDNILQLLGEKYKDEELTIIDGLKIDFDDSWIHLRKSNTEPIIRIYSESKSKQLADKLANQIINEIKDII